MLVSPPILEICLMTGSFKEHIRRIALLASTRPKFNTVSFRRYRRQAHIVFDQKDYRAEIIATNRILVSISSFVSLGSAGRRLVEKQKLVLSAVASARKHSSSAVCRRADWL